MLTINQYALHVARYIQKRRPELCWQACMYMAWRVAHCKYAMRSDRVSFSFIKLNGQIRDAEGTTNLSLIPEDKHPKPTPMPKPTPNYATVAFFDLDKSEWRSFRTDFFIDLKDQPLRESEFVECERCGDHIPRDDAYRGIYGHLCECCHDDLFG
jgi:hypothetical protein